MKNDLSCAVVRDLLPSYIDGLTSDETNHAIEGHIKACKECAKLLETMREPEGTVESDITEPKAVDFMKKNRRRIKTLVVALAAALVLLAACVVGLRWYSTPHQIPFGQMELEKLEVKGNELRVSGSLSDNYYRIKKVIFQEEDGSVYVSVTVGRSLFGAENSFDCRYTAGENIKNVKIGDLYVWEEGTIISEETARLYAVKHLYIGSMPDNGKTVNALKAVQRLGNFTNSLSTSEEPYGWTIYLEREFSGDEIALFEQDMNYYAAMLIATIDNLDWIRFEYTVDGTPEFLFMDCKMADDHYGSSVKAAAKSPKGLQEMMERWQSDPAAENGPKIEK